MTHLSALLVLGELGSSGPRCLVDFVFCLHFVAVLYRPVGLTSAVHAAESEVLSLYTLLFSIISFSRGFKKVFTR
jgi:hypothetical protein